MQNKGIRVKIKGGFVAVVGKPNAGKSSLVNRIVGEKVSIVSPKPQTTRNNILGIYNSPTSQIVFVDTPGMNVVQSGLDKFMQKSIKGATTDVDVVVVVVDIKKGIGAKEMQLIESHCAQKIPVVLVLSKCDLVDKNKIFDVIKSLVSLANKCEIVPLSSLKNKNIDSLVAVVEKLLPEIDETEKFFDEDSYTDKPIKFLVAEIVREKALFLLSREIPHGIAVVVTNFDDEGSLCTIDADIVCEKATHKAIILGHQGEMIKKIGHTARLTIQKILHQKVVLNLFVKVKPNWKNNMDFLDSLGYNINEI